MESSKKQLKNVNWNIVLPLLEQPRISSKKCCIEIFKEPELARYVPRQFFNTIKETNERFRVVKSAAGNFLSGLPNEIVNCEIAKHLFYDACFDHLNRIKTEEYIPVVMDQGTHSFKVGFAMETYPTYVLSTVSYKPAFSPIQNSPVTVLVEPPKPNYYIGPNSQNYRGVLPLQRTMSRGIVVNWDNYENILYHTFYNDLNIAPEEHPFHGTVPNLNPKANKEKMTQILFETFNVPALYFSTPQRVSLYGIGITGGAVVDIGEGATIVECISEGYTILNSIKKCQYGGGDITEFVAKQLSTDTQIGPATLDFWREIKEASVFAYLPTSEDENSENSPFSFAWRNKNQHQDQEKLPSYIKTWFAMMTNDDESIQVTHYNGTTVNLTLVHRALPVEVLFYPQLIGLECVGIHQLIFDSIMACDMDIRKELFKNVVLIGGAASIPGLCRRVKYELKRLLKLNAMVGVQVNVYAKKITEDVNSRNFVEIPPENRAFVGTGVLSSLATFQQMWTSKEEYDESGPCMTTRKIW